MEYNKDKVDELTLALLYLVMTKDKDSVRAWKGFEWGTMNRLHRATSAIPRTSRNQWRCPKRARG